MSTQTTRSSEFDPIEGLCDEPAAANAEREFANLAPLDFGDEDATFAVDEITFPTDELFKEFEGPLKKPSKVRRVGTRRRRKRKSAGETIEDVCTRMLMANPDVATPDVMAELVATGVERPSALAIGRTLMQLKEEMKSAV